MIGVENSESLPEITSPEEALEALNNLYKELDVPDLDKETMNLAWDLKIRLFHKAFDLGVSIYDLHRLELKNLPVKARKDYFKKIEQTILYESNSFLMSIEGLETLKQEFNL